MRVPIVGLAALAFALAACDALLGLGQFKDVSCGADCGADGGDGGGGIVAPDATGDVVTIADAGFEADAVGPFDAPPGDAGIPEGGWPSPTAHELWAHWPMPNPDASIGDDGGPLPNPMAYDAGPDGGSAVVYDEVTRLTWFPQSMQAPTYEAAWGVCGDIAVQGAGPWRVPTRIELVSLIDFTQTPTTINGAVFPLVTHDTYWTSSAVGGGDGSAGYWTVDFSNGFVNDEGAANNVLCVSGGTP